MVAIDNRALLLLASLLVACSRSPPEGPPDTNRTQALAARITPASASVRPAPPSRCPPEMAPVNRVCVDRWEAHLVKVDESGRSTASPFERPSPDARYEAASAPGVIPQGYLSRTEAALACSSAGKRLCSLGEWVDACEGAKKTAYPYGPRAVKGSCNVGKPHLMAMMFGTDVRTFDLDTHYNSPRLNQHPGFLAKTGEHERCVAESGVYDMVGNLHEWVSDPVDIALRKVLAERRIDLHERRAEFEGNAVFMGGFYSTGEQNGIGCRYITAAHKPIYHDYSIGFRCCRDAAPGTDL